MQQKRDRETKAIGTVGFSNLSLYNMICLFEYFRKSLILKHANNFFYNIMTNEYVCVCILLN